MTTEKKNPAEIEELRQQVKESIMQLTEDECTALIAKLAEMGFDIDPAAQAVKAATPPKWKQLPAMT